MATKVDEALMTGMRFGPTNGFAENGLGLTLGFWRQRLSPPRKIATHGKPGCQPS